MSVCTVGVLFLVVLDYLSELFIDRAPLYTGCVGLGFVLGLTSRQVHVVSLSNVFYSL